MTLKIPHVFVAVICTVAARIVSDDPGPQFGNNAPSDLNQGDVMMKDAVLYLTPSQIKAYEASQTQNPDQRNEVTEEEILNVQAEIKRQLEKQNIFAIDQSSNEKLVLHIPNPPPVVEEPIDEDPSKYSPIYEQKWVPLSKEQEEQKYFVPPPPPFSKEHFSHKPAESYSYIKFFTGSDVHETPKLQQFHPVPHDQTDPEFAQFLEGQNNHLPNKQYKLKPYEYKTFEIPRYEDLKEITKITELLEKFNKEQNTALNNQVPETNDGKLEQFEKESSDFKYTPNFEDHKKTEEDQKFYINIEKENALARAEALLKTSSGHRKEIIKRRPVRKEWPQRFIPLDSRKESSHRFYWKH